eukprot:TRINITY_DN4910_c0_g1_i3.p1 TRINITY_DN4910_c0_g1~~TRINITY_DN4910_c0_g1_i3.p1  ORF type:complete len:1148 (-),score=105.56 TRINITY_DN4910_c0_g1_i3:29-3472(-)
MYGNDFCNDASAMKAAGHELRSLARIITSGETEHEDVNVPLMTIVDYRGFRLTAVSVLPISKKTICYGSHDGGRTVYATYPAFNQRLEAIFQRLNLKPHLVRTATIGACGDIEGHWGSDGLLYLLDFARVFPPEAFKYTERYFPLQEPRAPFFKLLRPEFVAAYEKPLCSDAFSGWISRDPQARQHNKEVTESTVYLCETLIPKFVQEITHAAKNDRERYKDVYAMRCAGCMVASWGDKGKYHVSAEASRTERECTSVDTLKRQLVHLLHNAHTYGINRRYLGLIRGHLLNMPHQDCCTWKFRIMLYTEMAARVCKNIIRSLLREKMKELKLPGSEPYRKLVLSLFNVFSWASPHSARFWTSHKPPPLHDGDTSEEVKGSLEYYIERLCRQRDQAMQNKDQKPPSLNSSQTHGTIWLDETLLGDNVGAMLLPLRCAMRAKFGIKAISEEEWTGEAGPLPIFQGLFFDRLCSMLNIVLDDAPGIYEVLNGDPIRQPMPVPYEFLDPHLKEHMVRAKHMHLVDSSEGMALLLNAFKRESEIDAAKQIDSESFEKISRLLHFAREKFRNAFSSIPDHAQTLLNLGRVEHWLGLHCQDTEGFAMRDHFEAALKHFTHGVQILEHRAVTSKADTDTLIESRLKLAQVLCDWSMAPKDARAIKAESQLHLWYKAWLELTAVLKKYPFLKDRFTEEIKHIVTNKSTYLARTHNSGILVSTIMKIETLRKLNARESRKVLVAQNQLRDTDRLARGKPASSLPKTASASNIASLFGQSDIGGSLIRSSLTRSGETPTRPQPSQRDHKWSPSASGFGTFIRPKTPKDSPKAKARKPHKLSLRSSSLHTLLHPHCTPQQDDIQLDFDSIEDQPIALRAHTGEYIEARDADAVGVGILNSKAVWVPKRSPRNTIILVNSHQLNLGYSSIGEPVITRKQCRWEIVYLGGAEIALKSSNGRYLSTSRRGIVSVDKHALKSFERFKVELVKNRFYLRCCPTTSYLDAKPSGQVTVKAKVPKERSSWFVDHTREGSNVVSMVNLRSHKGYTLGLAADNPTTLVAQDTKEFHWEFRRHQDEFLGETVTFKRGDQYLTSNQLGMPVLASVKTHWMLEQFDPTWATLVAGFYAELQASHGTPMVQEMQSGVFGKKKGKLKSRDLVQ